MTDKEIAELKLECYKAVVRETANGQQKDDADILKSAKVLFEWASVQNVSSDFQSKVDEQAKKLVNKTPTTNA